MRKIIENLLSKSSSLVGDKNVPIFIKILWIVAYFLSVSGLIIYMVEIFFKWTVEPDIGTRESLKASSDFPAPALTICSPIPMISGFDNFTQVYMNRESFSRKLTVDEQNHFAALVQFCGVNLRDYALNMTKERNDRDLIKLMKKSSADVNDVFKHCVFDNKMVPCDKILNKVLSNDGYCFSFNMQGYHTIFNGDVISKDFESYKRAKVEEHWSLEKGYTSDISAVPYRAIPASSIKLLLALNESDYAEKCISFKEGYKVIFHMPNEMATTFHEHDYADISNRRTLLTISAKSYSTDPSLARFPPSKRKCFFAGERQLKFFKSYTKAQCELECLTNFTLRECECVRFSMPRDKDTRVCDLVDVECYERAHKRWPKNDIMSNGSIMPCDCFPPCDDIKYLVKYKTTGELHPKTSLRVQEIMRKDPSNVTKFYAALHLQFTDFQIENEESFVAYKLQNFVADCGGLLGLFMGISFLSVVDTILKLIVKAMLKRKKTEVDVENFSPPEKIFEHKNTIPYTSDILFIDVESPNNQTLICQAPSPAPSLEDNSISYSVNVHL